jgi:fatty acid amide hydrolase
LDTTKGLPLSNQWIAALREQRVTSAQLVQYIQQAINDNKAENALCLPLFEQAMSQAKACDAHSQTLDKQGLLYGLPVSIKECFDLKGTPSTFGLTDRKQDYPTQNSVYVDALIEAGAIVVGKSNVSQLLAFIETDNPVYGMTPHPKFPQFSCGGSSGGEGALVGAGLSPLGIGTDIGGSIRVPAAVNGACGIKPTGNRLRDTTRWLPQQDELPIKSAVGPIAQDALSLHYAIKVMNQKVASDWSVEPLFNFKDIEINRLRIGYFVNDGIFPVAQSVKEGIESAVETLKEAGAQVIEYRFPSLEQAERLYYGSMSLDNGAFLFDALGSDAPVTNLSMLAKIATTGVTSRSVLRSVLWLLGQKQQHRLLEYVGKYGFTDTDYLSASISTYTRKVIDSMRHTSIGELDAVISPILPVPAYLHNSFQHMGLAGTYSIINNVTGFPAGVACVGTCQNTDSSGFKRIDIAERQAAKCISQSRGLPQSVQITAQPWREDIVLALIDHLHIPYTQAYTNPHR